MADVAVVIGVNASAGLGAAIARRFAREGLHTVAERYFISDKVPVFGVVRWERAKEHLLLHRSHREPRQRQEGGGEQ